MKKILLEIRRGFRLLNQVWILALKTGEYCGKKCEPKHLILLGFWTIICEGLTLYIFHEFPLEGFLVELLFELWFCLVFLADFIWMVIGVIACFIYFELIDDERIKEKWKCRTRRTPFRTAVSLKLQGNYGKNDADENENNIMLDVDGLYVYKELKETEVNQHPVLNGITKILICDESLLENFCNVLWHHFWNPKYLDWDYDELDNFCGTGPYELYIMKFRCVESVLSWIKLFMHVNIEEIRTSSNLIYCKLNFSTHLRCIYRYGDIETEIFEHPDDIWCKRRK